MALHRFLTVVFLLATCVSAVEDLAPRNPYYGGFALPGTPALGAVHGCPVGTLTCADSSGIFVHCCPMYTFCGPYQIGAYCCPTADDCGSIVNAGLTCADPSWTLYQDAFDWCCANDTIGIALSDGECQPTSITFPSSEYANTKTQANDAAPPTNWPGGTVPPGVSTIGGSGKTSTGKTSQATKTSSLTVTSTGAAATATTTKSSTGAHVGAEHTFPLAFGCFVFAGTLFGAILL